MQWAQAEVRSCSAHGAVSSTKYQKCPHFGDLPRLQEIWGNFMMNEHLLDSMCMYSIINHSQSMQHDELHRKTPFPHHRDSMRSLELWIPKCNLDLRKFPLSLEFQVPSSLSSHVSQCSSLSSFSSTTRWASMHACIPMSIQLAI